MNYSTTGRRRLLTDTQIAAILQWHATLRSCKAMAKHLGISVGMLHKVISTKGQHYKQASPDEIGTLCPGKTPP